MGSRDDAKNTCFKFKWVRRLRAHAVQGRTEQPLSTLSHPFSSSTSVPQHNWIGADPRKTSRTCRQDCRYKGNCLPSSAVFLPGRSHDGFKNQSARLCQLYTHQPASWAISDIIVPEQTVELNVIHVTRHFLIL